MKADAKGNRNRSGDPAYSVAEVLQNLKNNAARHYPGYTVSAVLLDAAWDFSPIREGLAAFTGGSGHLLMEIFPRPSPPPGMVSARCTMALNIGGIKPRFVTTDSGALETDFALLTAKAGAVLPLLKMAPHSEDGVIACQTI